MDKQANDISEFIQNHKILSAAAAISVASLVILRKWFRGGQCYSKSRLDGKTVVITGANTGIGFETAKELAFRGARVVIGGRNETRTRTAVEELRKLTGSDEIVYEKLNLASLKSVRSFAENVLRKENKIHILINNAGIMACPHWKSKDGYEMQFAVNHLGHFHLTNLLLEKVIESGPSRIVNVSSSAHERSKSTFDDLECKNGYSSITAYGQSKLANVLFTRELHDRLRARGINDVTVNALHPGVIVTELNRHILTNPILLFLLWPLRFFLKTRVDGAQTSIYLAVNETLNNVSGKYFSDCKLNESTKHSQDKQLAEKLWRISEEMIKNAES